MSAASDFLNDTMSYYASNLTASANETALDCPEFDESFLEPLSFWLEGVTQVVISVLGLLGNLISAIILSR